jgi:hypothetical protein
MDKYQNAIFQYEYWRSEVKQLSGAIGDASVWFCDETGNGGYCCSNFKDHNETCINRYWDAAKAARAAYDATGDHVAPEKVDMCPSCKEIDRLVIERKKAKKEFGVAKRRITQIGKALLKESEHD